VKKTVRSNPKRHLPKHSEDLRRPSSAPLHILPSEEAGNAWRQIFERLETIEERLENIEKMLMQQETTLYQ
jgi:hypothetical protein